MSSASAKHSRKCSLGWGTKCNAPLMAARRLNSCAHSESLPGLILLDLMMPVMDGWEFRAEQRRDRTLAEVPVVMLSALDDIVEKALQSGAVGLPKPLQWQALLRVVERFCGTTRPRPGI